jgi:YD repeat-containing protein
MDSNAGLVTGEYFLNHQLVTYRSQGQSVGIDLQYSSAQANANTVVQYQFTTPAAGNSANITAVSASVSLAGVVQGNPTTYSVGTGLTDGETYNVPLQVNASALATGVYPYTMTETETFGTGSSAIQMTTENTGYANVVNQSSDPMGAGWSVGGLQTISNASPGGPALVTAGQQGTETFVPVYQGGGSTSYVQDLAIATSTASAQVLANNGAGAFAASVSATDNTVGTAAGDFDNNSWTDLAVLSTSALAIFLNNQSGNLTAGASYAMPAGYDAKGVVAGNFTGHANGVLDLAVLLASTSTNAYDIAEYTCDGDGTFAAPVISAVGNGVSSGTGADSMLAFGFNDGGDNVVAFTTDNGLADVMVPSTAGTYSPAVSLALPAGHLAIGVTAVDYNNDGATDLVVQVQNTNVEENGVPFVALDLFEGNGSGGFTDISTVQTTGQTDYGLIGIVAGDFQGTSAGLEVAVPVSNGGGYKSYIAVVPLTSSGTWGNELLYNAGAYDGYYYGTEPGNIVAADLNGAGKPSIAWTDNYTGQIEVLLADPASNQLFPVANIDAATSGAIGMLAVSPFTNTLAVPGYRGPSSDPSTLVQNLNGTWTRTYPDGTVLQFNSSGQETAESDRDGNTFTYAYVTSGPAAGALATITDPVGLVTSLAYNASGHLSTIADPAGRVTTFTINSSGDLTEIVGPDGATTQYGYNSSNQAISETNPNGNTAQAHYNSFGQLTSEALYGGAATTTIDAAQSNGLLAPGGSGPLATTYTGSVTDPNGHTTTLTFNWMSHPTGEANAIGGTTSTTYNGQGFPITVTDPMGRTSTYTYDFNGDVTSISEPFDASPDTIPPPGSPATATESIVYNDPYGVPTAITDFNGNTTTFALDSHGNVLQADQPGGLVEKWTYNSAGQPLTYTDANGNTTTYSYNSVGNLATVTGPGPGSPTIHYGYDAAGDVTSVTDPTGDTTTYT